MKVKICSVLRQFFSKREPNPSFGSEPKVAYCAYLRNSRAFKVNWRECSFLDINVIFKNHVL